MIWMGDIKVMNPPARIDPDELRKAYTEAMAYSMAVAALDEIWPGVEGKTVEDVVNQIATKNIVFLNDYLNNLRKFEGW